MIIKSKQTKYWDDETQTVTEQTILNKYNYKNHRVEVTKEIGWFNSNPKDIIIFRTYVRIYKDDVLIKRRLFYNGYTNKKTDWKKYVNEFLGLTI
jgi:hypothetical protein